jgi:hypothetical protein
MTRLSLFWIFVLLNYLYADVAALFAIVGSPNLADAPPQTGRGSIRTPLLHTLHLQKHLFCE